MSLWMKSISLTIEMKATEQHFPVELLTILYKFVQRKATEQNYPVVSLIMKYKVVQSNFWVCE